MVTATGMKTLHSLFAAQPTKDTLPGELNAKILTMCSLEGKEGLNLKYILLFEN